MFLSFFRFDSHQILDLNALILIQVPHKIWENSEVVDFVLIFIRSARKKDSILEIHPRSFYLHDEKKPNLAVFQWIWWPLLNASKFIPGNLRPFFQNFIFLKIQDGMNILCVQSEVFVLSGRLSDFLFRCSVLTQLFFQCIKTKWSKAWKKVAWNWKCETQRNLQTKSNKDVFIELREAGMIFGNWV